MKCLNCREELGNKTIALCKKCNWRNLIEDSSHNNKNIKKVFEETGDFITIKSKKNGNYIQIAYPSTLTRNDLELLPSKLKNAVKQYFKDPEDLDTKYYQNIYHSLYRLDTDKWERQIKEMKAKIKFAKFFKKTNFIKKS